MRIWLRACLLVLALGAVAGCAASSDEGDRIAELERRVEAAESRADAAEAESQTRTGDENAEPDTDIDVEDAADDDTGDAASPYEDGSECIKVPDVVGKDHQLAQDTMQAAGLYYLSEEDASGQGRMLILDRNWTTVKQRPRAGKCVPEDTEIVLYAVKDDEQ